MGEGAARAAKNFGVSSVGRCRSEVEAEWWGPPGGGGGGVEAVAALLGVGAPPEEPDATFMLASSLARLDCSGVITLPSRSPFTPARMKLISPSLFND